MSRELSYRRNVELLREAVGDGERGGALRYDAEELMATFRAWRPERDTLAHGFASFDWDGPLAELLSRPVIANMTKARQMTPAFLPQALRRAEYVALVAADASYRLEPHVGPDGGSTFVEPVALPPRPA